MGTSTEELRVKLLDAKKSETELRAVRRELEKTTGATSESGKASSSAAKAHEHSHRALGGVRSILSFSGGLLGLSAVGYGLKDVTQGGIKAQEQQLLLQNALKATGQKGKHHLGELTHAIDTSTGTGGFSAIEETEGLTQLVRLTKSSTQAIRLNKDAILLARGVHESYGSALSQVGRLQAGQVGRLQRYLGILQPVTYYEKRMGEEERKRYPDKLKEAQRLDKEATGREANRRILERYGGAVAAYNKSTAGSISNANNAFKNVTEQLGQKLLPAETAAAKGFGKLVTEISKGEGVWKTVGKDISTVWHDLEGVYKFLEKHKSLETLLGYGVAAGVGSKLLSKAPGAGLLSKALGGSPAVEGAEGAAASAPTPSGLLLGGAYSAYLLGKTSFGGNQESFFGNPYGQARHHEANIKALREENAHSITLTPRMMAKIHTQTVAAERKAAAQVMDPAAMFGALRSAVEHGMAGASVHMDGQKVGEVLRRNPRASREVAEGVNQHVKIMGVR